MWPHPAVSEVSTQPVGLNRPERWISSETDHHFEVGRFRRTNDRRRLQHLSTVLADHDALIVLIVLRDTQNV